jgi:hypothetical protein
MDDHIIMQSGSFGKKIMWQVCDLFHGQEATNKGTVALLLHAH